MEEERLWSGADERACIRDAARPLRKYGSTSSRRRAGDEYIKHTMVQGDTLQGIALKYGITTEKIRRANRMFASDSLFLREYLLIPVTKDSPHYETGERVTEPAPPSHRASIAVVPSHHFPPGSPDEKKSFDDFLSRVDSSLADIKKHVERSKENSEFVRELEEGFVRHRPTARLRQSASVGGASGSDAPLTPLGALGAPPPAAPAALSPPPVLLTQGRRVKSSLQRLERTQDELFQL